MVKSAIFLAAACLAASTLLTGVIRSYALGKVLDVPNERSSHTVPTPRGGGAAIVIVAVTALLIAAWMGLVPDWESWTLAGGMAALAATGWLDDTRGLRPRTRFASHLLISVLTVWNLGGLPLVRMGGSALTLGSAGAVLAVVGLIWCINLFNFMDGIDGIAGSQAVLIFAFGAATLFALGHAPLALMAVTIASATAGFLAWNWPPAKIFMGDVGSGPLGYLIGALAISSENAGALPVLAFALLGGVFIVDATVTLVRRVIRGHNPAVAHRDHAYQRLSRRWRAHRPVTLLALALTTAFGVVALMSAWRPGILVPALIASWVLLSALLLLLERSDPMFP